MLRLILVGASGAMGKTVANLAFDKEDVEIVAGISLDGFDCGFPIYRKLTQIREKADVIIDFSNRALLDDIIDYAKSNNLPVVFATTGYTKEDLEKIANLSKQVALIQEGNYSLGINVMLELAKKMSKMLGDFDIEIVESHHNKKKDNPSGTANMIFDAVNEGRDNNLKKVMRNFSHDDRREKTEVGISSVRAGSIVGEHRLILAGIDEVIELKHMAGSKKIFAVGAIKAAKFIKDKKPGRYSFSQVLEDSND